MSNKLHILLAGILSAAVFTALPYTAAAAEGRILDKVEAEQADTAAFAAEAEIFKSIGLSIALSIAQCSSQQDCKPAVDDSELDTLLDNIDDRINRLVAKQQDGKEDYTELLTAYVNEKENFQKYKDKLDALSAPAEETVTAPPAEEEPFAEEKPEATTTEATPPKKATDYSVFEDVGEALPGESPPAGDTSDQPADETVPEN